MAFFEELLITVVLLAWVVFVSLFVSKKFYEYLRKRGVEDMVAVYYNRKVVHMLVGGVCGIIVYFVFTTPLFPLIMSMFIALSIYLPHKMGKLMYWFQTKENMFEVSFAIMWGIIITLGWFLSMGDFRFGILPILFMSFGDAITGIVRNVIYKRRTKSWWGNLAMAIFSIPTGAILGVAGMLAGAVASLVEHFEFKYVDDNITVPTFSFIILILAKYYAPQLLVF